MKLVIGRPAISIDFWTRPKAVRTQVERTVAAIPAKTRAPAHRGQLCLTRTASHNAHTARPAVRLTAPVRRDLCQDTDPRPRSNNPVTPETPAPYTSTGSPAPVCVDVTGRHPQFSLASEAIEDRKSNTPHAVVVPGACVAAQK